MVRSAVQRSAEGEIAVEGTGNILFIIKNKYNDTEKIKQKNIEFLIFEYSYF